MALAPASIALGGGRPRFGTGAIAGGAALETGDLDLLLDTEDSIFEVEDEIVDLVFAFCGSATGATPASSHAAHATHAFEQRLEYIKRVVKILAFKVGDVRLLATRRKHHRSKSETS